MARVQARVIAVRATEGPYRCAYSEVRYVYPDVHDWAPRMPLWSWEVRVWWVAWEGVTWRV